MVQSTTKEQLIGRKRPLLSHPPFSSPSPTFSHSSPDTVLYLQSTCPCEGGCPHCLLEAKSKNTISQVQTLEGKGEFLPEIVRLPYEHSFQHDFSNVRIHTDANASSITEQLGAQAVTYNNNIAFRHGQYNITSSEGRKLLTHELTHIVQQHQTVGVSPGGVTRQHDPAEQEAESVSQDWTPGKQVTVHSPMSARDVARSTTDIEILRHNWEEVALYIHQSRQAFLSHLRSTIGTAREETVPQPPDMTSTHSLDMAMAIIRRDRADTNFPPAARNSANQLLRSIGIMKFILEIRLLGGAGGAAMQGSLRDLQELMSVDRITAGTDTEDEWYSNWVFNVQTEVDMGSATYLSSVPLSTDSVELRGSAFSRFETAYRRAELLRSVSTSDAVRARTLHFMRQLERVMYGVASVGGDGELIATSDQFHDRMIANWLSVYHRLGGTGQFIFRSES